jgi:hypothetical protein
MTKYLRVASSGGIEEANTTATGGAPSADLIPRLNGQGRLDEGMMPVGIAADTQIIQATEALVAGDFVNIHDSTGPRVRKADASNGRAAHGFVLSAVAANANATVYFEGQVVLTGLTPGQRRWLGTAGATTPTPPTTAGHLLQPLGTAITTTLFATEISDPITRN